MNTGHVILFVVVIIAAAALFAVGYALVRGGAKLRICMGFVLVACGIWGDTAWYTITSQSNRITLTNLSDRWLLKLTIESQIKKQVFYLVRPGGKRVARSFPSGWPDSVWVTASTGNAEFKSDCYQDKKMKTVIEIGESHNITVILDPDGTCIAGSEVLVSGT